MSSIRGLKNITPLDFNKDLKSNDAKENNSIGNQYSEEDKKLREVADMYEKFFIKEMMRHMKSSLNTDGLIKKNNAEKIFSEQLDEQYSAEWNKRGGFGISDLIYDQVKERHKDQFVSNNTTAVPNDLAHEQMLWQIELEQKNLKK